ncbi:MAG: TolC family protein [Pseudomonadota bacterium]
MIAGIVWHPRRPLWLVLGTIVVAVGLVGCTLSPQPFTTAELHDQAIDKIEEISAAYEPVREPITLYEAIARALKYNLRQRVALMEQAVQIQRLDVTKIDLLPQIAASAGYTARDNTNLSLTREQGQALGTTASISSQRVTRTMDLQIAWNVLDFGLSYFRAKQQADEVLIAEEQRRRVVQNLVQEVRFAYWRAVAAENLQERLVALIDRVDDAIDKSRTAQQQRLNPPLESLLYQQDLLETMRQLRTLERELVVARTEIASLMNLAPGTEFRLVPPQPRGVVPVIYTSPDEMHQVALALRPEMRQESYRERISANEVRRAALSVLPGIEFTVGANYTSSEYQLNNTWYNASTRVSANLLGLFTSKARLGAAQSAQDLARARALATGVSVMTQVHVSQVLFDQSVRELYNSEELMNISAAIRDQTIAQGTANATSELEIIQSEAAALINALRYDVAYAGVQNAFGRVLTSVGIDPLPNTVASHDLETITLELRQALEPQERNGLRVKIINHEIPDATIISAAALATPQIKIPKADTWAPDIQRTVLTTPPPQIERDIPGVPTVIEARLPSPPALDEEVQLPPLTLEQIDPAIARPRPNEENEPAVIPNAPVAPDPQNQAALTPVRLAPQIPPPGFLPTIRINQVRDVISADPPTVRNAIPTLIPATGWDAVQDVPAYLPPAELPTQTVPEEVAATPVTSEATTDPAPTPAPQAVVTPSPQIERRSTIRLRAIRPDDGENAAKATPPKNQIENLQTVDAESSQQKRSIAVRFIKITP